MRRKFAREAVFFTSVLFRSVQGDAEGSSANAGSLEDDILREFADGARIMTGE